MTAKEVYKTMLKFGYFPNRLNGILNAEEYGDWVLKNEPSIKSIQKNKVFKTFDYKATRNNNAPRYFGLIHPEAYARLSYSINQNWKSIFTSITDYSDYEKVSMIRPSLSNKDKRLFSLEGYDKPKDQELLYIKKQAGAKVLVKVDIANCFASIYTHSIPWALVGKDKSKKNSDCSDWFNTLDCDSRNLQDRETLGIPIGSDTSNLIAELILSQIDKNLSLKFEYIRYIDDYTCFCADTGQANSFISELVRELGRYKLKLNSKKTKVIALPHAIDDEWVRSLRLLSNWREVSKKNKTDVIGFLDEASELFIKNPHESPIRYAIKVLTGKNFTDYEGYELVLYYVLSLCILYPYIIDLLGDLVSKGINTFPRKKTHIVQITQQNINKLVKEHIEFARTDAIVWSYTYAIMFSFEILDTKRVKEVALEQEDYFMQLMLYLYNKKLGKDYSFVKPNQLSDITEAWLLEYHFRLLEKQPFTSNPFLELLRQQKVSFLDKKLTGKL